MYEEDFCPLQDRLFVPGLGFEKCTIEMEGAVLQDLAAFTFPRPVRNGWIQRLSQQGQVSDLIDVLVAKLGRDIEWEIAGEGGQRPILLQSRGIKCSMVSFRSMQTFSVFLVKQQSFKASRIMRALDLFTLR
jgi:hypothetical protein